MSKLETLSVQFRDSAINRNNFNNGDQYSQSHDDALSTGDEPGKGEKNGSIGGLTDIKSRTVSIVRNKYKTGYEYNLGTA